MTSNSCFPNTPLEGLPGRHIGPSDGEISEMLQVLGCSSLADLADRAVPSRVRTQRPLKLPKPLSEYEALSKIRQISHQNVLFRSFIGMGYYGCVTPPVIQRNILENPAWYTPYTPYQSEISQGRLEM
ncbi:MAG: glycine dehydrogenase (aminomethyl-transferring), partial [Verrucomicrobiae bacterium]|nr:glycine dehydrogenase (aminomethyl-transferring) [Verrucomicrobiae bacterium]